MADDATLTETSAPEAVTAETTTPNEGIAETALGGASADGETAEAETEAKADDAEGEAEGETEASVVPEKYELKATEGNGDLDPEAIALAEPVFKELGLSNDQAQQLIPIAEQFAQSVAAKIEAASLANIAETRAAWLAEAKADPEIGGNQFDSNIVLAAKALDTLGFPKGSAFRTLLDDSGLGNHAEMIRAFVKVGKAVSEDSDFVRSGVAASGPRTLADTLYPAKP
ncbi:putative protease [uncultured Caudovirales phage]|uniref:Putative protease n=1 Tax=uncultured Caudovirales phage TaxID=2100421 RepID=A0A6J5KJ03_9CAUD|nr:putative protease [uncultured Caudovirales phage]